MWISFQATGPFAIKVHIGGVNALSGDGVEGTEVQRLRRKKRHLLGESVQDYMVAPNQRWLDGIASGSGSVRQFVAMPVGKGYSVEAQLTGDESVGGIQIEITPSIMQPRPRTNGRMFITVQALTGKTLKFAVSTKHSVEQVKEMIWEVEGCPPDQQRLVFHGKQLEDGGMLFRPRFYLNMA
jgi:hypothetical protein